MPACHQRNAIRCCSECKEWRPHAGKGQCFRCYYRLYRATQRQSMNLCRNCGIKKANRSRGLCWGCWHKKDVLDKFPVASPVAALHPCNTCGVPMADIYQKICSTCIRPAQQQAGYRERIRRYAERAALVLPLFEVA